MALFDNPWANLTLGLASLKNPSLLGQVQQAQQQKLALQRQVEEDKRRRAMEDFAFQQKQREASGLQRAQSLISGDVAPGVSLPLEQRQQALAAALFQGGQPQAALGLLQPKTQEAPINIREFETAKARGYIPPHMGFEDYLKARKAPATVIQNIPPPPSGYQVKTSPSGEVQYVPVKGGPVYQKAKAEFQKKESTLIDLKKAVGELRSEVETQGPQISVGRLNAATAQKLSSKYTNVMIQLKELYNLGVLQGPDMAIMERAILDPSSYTGLMKGKEAIMEGLNTLSKEMENRAGTVNRQYLDFGFEVDLSDPTPPTPGTVKRVIR